MVTLLERTPGSKRPPGTEPTSHPPSASSGKALYRTPEAMHLLSMSRTVIYEQIRAGRLRTVRLGRTRLVPAVAIAEYVVLVDGESRRTV